MAEKKKSIFAELYEIDVTAHLEAKGKQELLYLKWSVAFRILIEKYPESTWRVLTQEEITHAIDPANMVGFMVGTEITIKNGDETITRRETLPVTNYSNQAIVEPTSFDVNTSIKRCYVKTLAHLGLGMRVYENVTYPEDDADPEVTVKKSNSPKRQAKQMKFEDDVPLDLSKNESEQELIEFIDRCGVTQTEAIKYLGSIGYETIAEIPTNKYGEVKTEIKNMGRK